MKGMLKIDIVADVDKIDIVADVDKIDSSRC
jgi:hypothetical protein